MPLLLDITGLVSGRLTAISYHHGSARGAWWLCRCACGREIVRLGAHIRRGKIKSCGCGPRGPALLRDREPKRRPGRPPRLRIREGGAPEYGIWTGIKQRCYNPRSDSYKHYGARGIVMSDEWRESYEAFSRDMGPRPPRATIERMDNGGPYSKENCRWATYREQARNKRQNHSITINGVTKCLVDWAAERSIPHRTISNRILRHGWDPERAVMTPPEFHSPRGEGPYSRLRPKTPRIKKPKPIRGPVGRPWRTLTIDGVTKTARQWAADAGVDYTSFRGRISHGWDPKWALVAPRGAAKEFA